MDDIEPIRMCSGANLGRNCGNLRPPAVVTEYMSQGSVKQAIARKAEVVQGNMHRLVVAMDAAKVRVAKSGSPPPCHLRACCMRKAEVVQGNMYRLIVAMDAAKVRAQAPDLAPTLPPAHACCCVALDAVASNPWHADSMRYVLSMQCQLRTPVGSA
jgi:hypothetical protein